MSRDVLLVRTKLTPPRAHRRLLPRPALTAKLREARDYRLTLVQAGTGYGKSTALAALVEGEAPSHYVWYSVSEADADPQHFLSYLIEAFRLRLPALSDAPLALLHEISAEGDPGAWSQVVDALINALVEALHEPLLLIVDDYHFTASSPEVNALGERFITYLPPDLHVVVSTRYPLHGKALTAWRAKGEVLDLARDDFVLQPAEIELLFRDTYGMQLTPEDIAILAHKTEGWPIALQLVWQGLRHNPTPRVPDLLMASPGEGSLGALFDYLAHDVFGRQPPEIQTFLNKSAVLRALTPAACAAVTGTPEGESAAMLRRLRGNEGDATICGLFCGIWSEERGFKVREDRNTGRLQTERFNRRGKCGLDFLKRAGETPVGLAEVGAPALGWYIAHNGFCGQARHQFWAEAYGRRSSARPQRPARPSRGPKRGDVGWRVSGKLWKPCMPSC